MPPPICPFSSSFPSHTSLFLPLQIPHRAPGVDELISSVHYPLALATTPTGQTWSAWVKKVLARKHNLQIQCQMGSFVKNLPGYVSSRVRILPIESLSTSHR